MSATPVTALGRARGTLGGVYGVSLRELGARQASKTQAPKTEGCCRAHGDERVHVQQGERVPPRARCAG